MAQDSTPAKPGGMLSLYANLLDPSADSSPGTISRAPVVFKQGAEGEALLDDASAKKQAGNALRFQPTKRPQLANQKQKPKPALPKAAPAVPATGAVKTSIADWAATEEDDVNGFFSGPKRQRGGRKKRKKNQEAQEFVQNWDDIYDPSRPNVFEEYKHSDEQISEVREWKDRLYAHRMAKSPSRDSYSDEDYARPANRQFAPPGSFAPPPNFNNIPPARNDSTDEVASRNDSFAQRHHLASPPSPPPDEPVAPILDASTGDDAYLRRLQLSGQAQPPAQAVPPPPASQTTLNAIQASSATISRAPVRYTLPPAPKDIPASQAELEEVLAKEAPAEDEVEEDGQRSLRPGQKGFAERLLSKYGWTKGSGLGATGSGIAKPLQVQVEKRKKRPDSEGGGFVTPAGRGKIIGGNRKQEEAGKFGPMSEIIILRGMLDGMDVDAELTGSEGGGLMQEIGEECNEKVNSISTSISSTSNAVQYGRVERVYISRDSAPPVPVFIKFTNQLSALRVSALI
ncbi:hypothetical protein BJX70DRAFT_292935 [Aspergillus crustosus]